MRICVVPIDNRPVCYNLIQDIASIDGDIELFLPPREFLGTLQKKAQIDKIFEWLESLNDVDSMILSLDTLAYGGLVASRRGENGVLETFEEIKQRILRLKPLLKNKKVFAFSSIMRIPNNNYNDEEKVYWADYGTKIFEYSYLYHKNGVAPDTEIPKEILEDYLSTRTRNFEINKLYLEWQKEGLFDTLIFSKDDCAEYGLNIKEAQVLEASGGITKTGADEIPLALFSRAIQKEIKVYPLFIELKGKDLISNYEDVSIEKSVLSQLELGGFTSVLSEKEADVVLLVNNFLDKQGELVMNWPTKPFDGNLSLPQKPFCIADVRFTNGADNSFVKQFLEHNIFDNKFYGYAAWNTSANTLGSLLAGLKVKWQAKNYRESAFKRLQSIRLLDDWAYQANVRNMIKGPCEVKKLMEPYEKNIESFLDYKLENTSYTFPWYRKFEIEIIL